MEKIIVLYLWVSLVVTSYAATLTSLEVTPTVCEVQENTLHCFVRTLQSDMEAVLHNVEDLKIECSDQFYYESALRSQHFGVLPQLRQLQLDYCKIRQIPNQAFKGLDSLEHLTIQR